MKVLRNRTFVTAVLILVGLMLFQIFGFNFQKKVSISCNPSSFYGDWCPEIAPVEYGFPIVYSTAHNDNVFNGAREEINPLALTANFLIWTVPLPFVYLILTRKKKAN